MNDLSLYERVPLLDNSFSVKMMSFDRSHNLIPHWHENIELLYFYNGYLYIVGIPDIHSNGDLNDQLCYLHNIYPWTKNQYDDLKSKQDSLLARYRLDNLKN